MAAGELPPCSRWQKGSCEEYGHLWVKPAGEAGWD